MDPKIKKNLGLALAASQMGFMVVAGLLGGLWIDREFGWMPIFTILGLVLGFFSGFRVLILLARSNSQPVDKEEGSDD